MNPLNPIFAIIIYFIAFVTAYLINLKYKIKNDNSRYETIDGIRGLLALGVFIHHSSIWFQYLQIKIWTAPKSNLYTQLGETSVSLFFMITSFLFLTKLLNTNDKKFNWNDFFISRFFRLVPIYLVSILILVIIIFTISNWELEVTLTELIKEIFCWGTFTIAGSPKINGFLFTNIINAGICWSLPYEWLFYFSLPIISLFILKKRISTFYLIICILFVIAFFYFKKINQHHLLSFAGGIISPFLIKYSPKKINFTSKFFSVLLLFCLALILFFDTSNNYSCKLLIILIFNLIALGNTVFGILKSSTLKLLSEISYSTYLIHGTIIFIVFYFYFGIEKASKLSATKFCLTIFLITPIIVVTSFLLYKFIEKPCLNYYKKSNFNKIKQYL